MNNWIQRIINKVTGGDSTNKAALLNIFKNFNWLALENIFRTGLSLFVLAWVARYLGPEQFGEFNYAFAFATLFSILSTLGLDPIVVKRIVTEKEKANSLLGSALFLRVIGSVVMIAASVTTAWFTSKGNPQIVLFVAIFSFTFFIRSFEVIDYWFQAKVKSKFAVYSRSFAFFTVSVIKIGLILTKAPLEYFVWVILFEQILSITMMMFFYKKVSTEKLLKLRISKQIIKELIIDSWPLALGGIATLVYMKIDQVMIANILDNKQLGIYYSGAKLSEVWYFIPSAVAASVFPSILHAKQKSIELYNNRIQLLYDVLLWAGILLAITISLGAPIIVKIFGDQYINSGPVLRIHVWTNVLFFQGAISAKWVIAENLTRNALVRAIFGATLNVLLNLYLIPRYGVVGSAMATVASYAFVHYFSMAFAKSTYPAFAMASRSFNLFRVLGRLKK